VEVVNPVGALGVFVFEVTTDVRSLGALKFPSASCAWIDYAFEGLQGLATSSFSPPPLRTYASSPS